jgi:hypothetical protein
MLFGVSLEEYLSNFLQDFFFFANFVVRSNGWLNAVAHMIRLISILFSLVHSDLSGIIRVPSFGGAHYAILFIENKSRFSFFYLVSTKDRFAKSLEVFSQMIETQFDTKIKHLYTDCESEYIGKETRSIIEKRGIIHTTTASHTPAHMLQLKSTPTLPSPKMIEKSISILKNFFYMSLH